MGLWPTLYDPPLRVPTKSEEDLLREQEQIKTFSLIANSSPAGWDFSFQAAKNFKIFQKKTCPVPSPDAHMRAPPGLYPFLSALPSPSFNVIFM